MELTPELAARVVAHVLGVEVDPGAATSLYGSDRSLVARVSPRSGEPVVVKLHRTADDSTAAVREPAALSLVGSPRLIGVSTDPPGLVMQDLGAHQSLADSLLGDDPVVARERVLAWSAALARSQVPGEGFWSALQIHAERLGHPVVPAADGTPGLLGAAAEALGESLPRLGIRPEPAALDELRHLDELLGGDVRRLTPTDACPDNNLWLGDRFVLIDYEAAQVRHVAWDVAYLRVPFPSCWCSWALPADVADEALATWKQEFDDRYVDTAQFESDLRLATLGWAFVSCWWFLRRAEDEAAAPPSDPRMPSGRSRLLHRFTELSTTPDAPALAALAQEIGAALRASWGDLPLELAPAFRS